MPEAAAAIQGTARSDEPNQLQLRFFAVIDGFTRRPPERALWRVLIHTALAKTEAFTVGGRRISAAAVHHVALALYMHADSAGVIHEFSEESLAEQCRMGEKHIRAARKVLNDLRVVRSTRASRRRPASHRMNLGGLDWPAVRRRAGKPSPDLVSDGGGREESPSPVLVTGLGDQESPPESGPGDRTQTPESGPGDRTQTPESGPGDRTTGLYVRQCLPTAVPCTDRDLKSERAGRQRTAREPARRPNEPASEQQVAMLMSLQRKHRLPSQHVSEAEARTWTRGEMSEALSELENLEERRGRTPTREELLRLEEARRYQQRYGR